MVFKDDSSGNGDRWNKLTFLLQSFEILIKQALQVDGWNSGAPFGRQVDAMRTVAAVCMGSGPGQITRSAMADSGKVSSGRSPSKGRLK